MHVSRLLTPVDCQYGRLSSAMVLFAGLGACLLLSWVSFSGGRGRLVAMIGTLLPLGLGLSLAWQLVAFIRETGCEA
jgi:hypothetical protein